jgi:hypothetical protein
MGKEFVRHGTKCVYYRQFYGFDTTIGELCVEGVRALIVPCFFLKFSVWRYARVVGDNLFYKHKKQGNAKGSNIFFNQTSILCCLQSHFYSFTSFHVTLDIRIGRKENVQKQNKDLLWSIRCLKRGVQINFEKQNTKFVSYKKLQVKIFIQPAERVINCHAGSPWRKASHYLPQAQCYNSCLRSWTAEKLPKLIWNQQLFLHETKNKSNGDRLLQNNRSQFAHQNSELSQALPLFQWLAGRLAACVFSLARVRKNYHELFRLRMTSKAEGKVKLSRHRRAGAKERGVISPNHSYPRH